MKQRTTEFTLGEHRVHVLPIAPDGSSAPHSGAARELARFQLAGRVYALITDSPVLADAPAISLGQTLTRRELQVVALVAEGLLNKEIADRLRISEWTVCAHLRRIYTKLGVPSRAAMAYRCAGWLALPELSKNGGLAE